MAVTDHFAGTAEALETRLRAMEGAKTGAIRDVRRVFSRRIASWPPENVIRLAFSLLAGRSIAERFVAYELIAHHSEALSLLTPELLEKLGWGIDSWGAVDMFAACLAGPCWRRGQLADATVRSWARSDDRWWRRAALASTISLNSKSHGGKGDPRRTLNICRILIADRDDMVVKAMSWALRELAKRDAGAVKSFLDRFKNGLAPRVVKEVRNKLRTGLKNPGK